MDKEPRIDKDPYHLVLLARDEAGYRNLVKLTSIGFVEGFYYKPRVDDEVLARHSEGLVALSSCLAGEIPQLILRDKLPEAKKKALLYRDIFGPENFFLEVQSNGISEQDKVNRALFELSRELGIPLVATNDVHYVKREDSGVHDVLLCIQTGKTVDDESRLRFPTDEFFLKSHEEMERSFREIPEALSNTLEIAERCNFEFEFGRSLVPAYEVPEGHTEESFLRALCEKGLRERYEKVTPELEARLNYELDVIRKMGYCGYFLIVWDFIHFARQAGIYVGPGRGSCPGSIVAYSLGITSIDPLKYDLIFERFLNPERVSMPDIDVDFCFERRGEVIDYVTRKYGEDRVAQIITFGTMAAKAAIRDVGRALNFPYAEVDRIAKLVPTELNTTIDRALESSPELKGVYDGNEQVKRLIDTARAVEGMPRHASVHAAGVVISKDPLADYVPLYKTGDGAITTQFPMEDLEPLGILKMDFLGLRTLTVIGKTLDIIAATRGEKIDIMTIPLDDARVYEMLRSGDSLGVFQLESSLFQSLLKEVKPTTFEDIIAILALGRPGPMNRIQDFARQKHGLAPIIYAHPKLEPILKETYGIMLYQEQVMRVASDLAGFTMGEADLMRRAMGKKKPEVLASLRDRFLSGAEKNGVDRETAGEIFDLMEYFSGYGFNKSHSAAYAFISYQTAYLKAHYPAEFMAALLTSVTGNTDKVAFYVNECRQKGIEILPPDINESLADFTVIKGGRAIRFGLAAVKNVGRGAVDAIIRARKKHERFKSLVDFCEHVDTGVVNKKTTESLIRCGAFDSLGARRSQLIAVLDEAYEAAQAGNRERKRGQVSFLDLFAEKAAFCANDIELPDVPEFLEKERLAMEKELLGLYISGHPLDPVASELRKKATVASVLLGELRDGVGVSLAGIITGFKKTVTKNGQPMGFLTLEDLTGSCEVIVFPKTYEKYGGFIREEEIIVVQGRADVKEEGTKVIANEIIPLTSGEVHITIDATKSDSGSLGKLKRLLGSSKGNAPVFIEVGLPDGSVLVSTSPEFWVNPDGDLEKRTAELIKGKDIGGIVRWGVRWGVGDAIRNATEEASGS